MKRAAECELDTSKAIQLDVSTRWNSTYLMLRDLLHYKPAFIGSRHRTAVSMVRFLLQRVNGPWLSKCFSA
jgi:hypothetical protein